MSAILDSLRNHREHPIMLARMADRYPAAGVRTAAARPVSVSVTAPAPARRFSYAEADAAVAKLPVGRFALPRTTPDGSGNMVTFFKVFETRRGNRIVMLVAAGGGDYSEVRLSTAHQVAAATHIAGDVKAARQMYGRETATCGDCGRALSNDESRAYGIGPKCRNK